jgi:DNA primase
MSRLREGTRKDWVLLVERVRRRPILELVQELGLNPRRAGGEFVVSCPFHQDRTPSLFINPEKGLWHCFSCGRGGDGIALYRAVRSLDFATAVKELAA